MPTIQKLIEKLQKFKPTDHINTCKMDCGEEHLIVTRKEDEQFMEFVNMEEY